DLEETRGVRRRARLARRGSHLVDREPRIQRKQHALEGPIRRRLQLEIEVRLDGAAGVDRNRADDRKDVGNGIVPTSFVRRAPRTGAGVVAPTVASPASTSPKDAAAGLRRRLPSSRGWIAAATPRSPSASRRMPTRCTTPPGIASLGTISDGVPSCVMPRKSI